MRSALALVLLWGTILQPAFIRCVDAAGRGSIELPGADCCAGDRSAEFTARLAPADGGCVDETLTVPAIKRSSDADALSRAPSTLLVYSHARFVRAFPVWPSITTADARVPFGVPAHHLTAQLNC